MEFFLKNDNHSHIIRTIMNKPILPLYFDFTGKIKECFHRVVIPIHDTIKPVEKPNEEWSAVAIAIPEPEPEDEREILIITN